jgi:predicted GNAT family acetyltransferase
MQKTQTQNEQTLKIEELAERNWSLRRDNDQIVLETRYAYIDDQEGILIEHLFTPSRIRGRGYAREAMERLCEVVDEESIPLFLCAEPFSDSPLTVSQLLSFYESLGFDDSNREVLIRNPS